MNPATFISSNAAVRESQSTPFVALFNDTGRTAHVGCRGVSLAHDTMLAAAGFKIAVRSFLGEWHELWQGNPENSLRAFRNSRLARDLRRVDAVIVNGEGTIHHGGGLHLLTILAGAQEMGLPTFLVNAVFQECECYADTLRKLTDFTVRDAASSAYLKQLGIPHRIVLDSIFDAPFDSNPLNDFKGKVVITDWHPTREGDVGCALKQLLRELGTEAVFYPLEDPQRERDWRHAVADLAQAKLVITARHHGVCLAALAGVPFVALGSNTWKVEGMLELLPGNLKVCSDLPMLRQECERAALNRKLFKEIQRHVLGQRPLSTFEKLACLPPNKPLATRRLKIDLNKPMKTSTSGILLLPTGISQLATMIAALRQMNIETGDLRVLSIISCFNAAMETALRAACEIWGARYCGNISRVVRNWRLDPDQLSPAEAQSWRSHPEEVISERLLQIVPELREHCGLRTLVPARPNMPEDFYFLSALKPSSVHLVADGIQNELILRDWTTPDWRGFNSTLAVFPAKADIWCPDYLALDSAEIGNAKVIEPAIMSAVYRELAASSLGKHLEQQIRSCGTLPPAIVLSQHLGLSKLCTETEELDYYSAILSHLEKEGLSPVLFKRHPRDPGAKTQRLLTEFPKDRLPVVFTDDLAACVPIECLLPLWAGQELTVIGSSSSALLGLRNDACVTSLCADADFVSEPLRQQVLQFSAKHGLKQLRLENPAVSNPILPAEIAVPQTQKHILFVSHDASRSGAPMFLLNLLRWLKANTSASFKVLLRNGGPLEPEFRTLAETFTPETFGRHGRNLAGVNLIYSNTCTNGELIDSLGRGSIPVLTHMHELDYAISYFGEKSWMAATRQTSHYFGCAEAVVQTLAQRGISGNVSRHYEAISVQEVQARAALTPRVEAKKNNQIPENAFVVAACGSADWRKGTDLFIELAQVLKQSKTSRPVHLVWIGRFPDDNHRQQYLAAVAKAGVPDRLHFAGEQANPCPLLNACDLFVLTSREDPFPLVMLEAAALGKPLVCFEQSGGAPEFCTMGAGIAVPHLDVQAMAKACAELLEDEVRRNQIGERAAQLTQEHFDINVIAPAIWNELQELRKHGLATNSRSVVEATQSSAQESGSQSKVSIVIPVHNNLKLTAECLNAIHRNTSEQSDYEIIVVDDASDDGTFEFLRNARKFYPRLRTVQLGSNSGFSRACNAGARAARGEFVLFLNNDTQPEAGWLEALLCAFDQDSQLGIAGSLLLFPKRTANENEPDRVQHCGIAFNSRKESLHLYKFCLADQPFVRQTREYQAVTAASMMIPRDLFNQVGGFDEGYLNGGEDLDLCFKIRALGRKIICCAESVIRHFESASVKSGHSSSNANYRRFLERWQNQIQADEEQFYQNDGISTQRGMRIAMVTPLRPLKTGVADYVEELLPELSKHARIDFFVDDFVPSSREVLKHCLVHSISDIDGADWTYRYDAVVYHLGNNRFHGEIYKLAANRPGIVVLHEYDCRGCANEPSSRLHLRGVLNRSQAVIVHNEHSRRLLHQEFPSLPISVIPHLLSEKAMHVDAAASARERVQLPKNAFVITSLGLVQLHKRNHITLEAFARFAKRNPQALLVLAGEAPDSQFRALLNKRIQDESLQNRVRITGWVTDEQFFDYLSAADVTVNLRYPARGEESGSLTRILGCGKPAIVSNFAQFADIPDECVIKLDFDNEVNDLVAIWENLIKNPGEREKRATAARNYYRTRNDARQVAALYAQTCREAGRISEGDLQLRRPRYQFPSDKRAKLLWQAPVFDSHDRNRGIILALDRLKVPIRVQSNASLNSSSALLNPEDFERLNELSTLETSEQVIQVFSGDPTAFRRASNAFATVAFVRSLDAVEIRRWIQTRADEFWAGSEAIRQALIQAGVAETQVALVPPGVSALAYGATVNELRPNGLFRFLCVTDWSPGSGWETVARAFLREFRNPAEAQLVIKCSLTHLSHAEKVALYQQTLSRFSRENPEFSPEQFRMISGDTHCRGEDIMPAFYSSGSALIHVPTNPSTGRAVIEALALGLPVIAGEAVNAAYPDLGKFLKIVRRKPNQSVADETHLRQLMRALVADRLGSQLPAIKARQHCLSHLTWESIAEFAAARLANLMDRETTSTTQPDLEKKSAPSTTVDKPATYLPPSELLSARQVRWQSPVFDPSGYADESRYLIRHLKDQVPMRLESIGRMSKQFREAMEQTERRDLEKLLANPVASEHIQVTVAPAYALRRDPQARYAVGRTTFETDRLPADWVAACNGMDEIWVPGNFNADTFRKAGVTVPIHIVPQGVDTERFRPGLKPLQIQGRRGFAFLSVFEWIHRKGWDVLLRAWAEAFRADDDVCLIIRSYLPNVTEGSSSTDQIKQRISDFLKKELGRTLDSVAPIIVLGEQIAQLDMPRLYASADAFVLPSRGEGWGRPFMEAMACGLPVIGTRWSGQLAFMNDASSLLIDIEGLENIGNEMEFPMYRGHQWACPSVNHLKTLLQQVLADPESARKRGQAAAADVRENWSWTKAAAFAKLRIAAINEQLGAKPEATASQSISKHEATVVAWEGSFLDFGSLSHVNRAITESLEKDSSIDLRRVNNGQTPGDILSNYKSRLSNTVANAEITVRHSWPPNWSKPKSGKLAVIQPWEFGALPADWVKQSANVDEFWVPTETVRRFYTESGIDAAKVHIVPNGIDPSVFHPDASPRQLPTKKNFRFLFVGGTIGRKGPDVLLNAYLKNFTAADDVCLVIKDFGGNSVYRGQTFAEQIKQAQRIPNAPEILHLDEELSPEELPGLYTACQCLVHPYRGEGFGLPVLEAMACGLPVIVTGGGATDDFATDDFAYRIPSTRRSIGNEVGGMKTVSEAWLLEPDANALADRMKWAVANPNEARQQGSAASEHARRNWTWQRAAQIAAERIRALTCRDAAKPVVASAKSIPAVATLGVLSKAREQYARKAWSQAWTETIVAIGKRPFHPEAFLLLAEIALAAGDGDSAKKLAQHARVLAPGWKAAKQFLQKPLKGNATPDWLVLPESISNSPSAINHRLSVCVITKNEERFIEQCLKSIKPIAHQIVVVDTGSTDRTVEIAKSLGAEVHAFTWCDDFSAARNAALEHATGDWVLMLDADEELPADQHANLLKDIQKNSAIACRLPLVNIGQNDGRSFVPRLFRNAPGAHFYGRIHEQVFPSLIPYCKPWGLETLLGSAQLLHHGYTKELVKDRNKIERNLRLLEQAVVERPNDPNLIMNFGLELVRSGELTQGLEKYRQAFQLMSAQPSSDVVPELREVLLTQITAHLYKERQHDEIVRILASPLAKNGGLTASLHFALGLALFELKQPREAAEQMRQCVAKRNQPALAPINTDILTAAPNHCLALSLAQTGDVAGAKEAFKTALTESGRLENVKFDFAKLLASQNEPVEALHKLHEVVAQDPTHVNAWKLGAEIALKQREFLEFACDWTSEAIRALPNDPTIIAFRAEALLLSQQTQHARPLWEKACNCVRPPNALAAFILCSAVESQPIPETRNADEELAASKAFVGWYQRLVNAGAKETVIRLNSRVDALRTSLPTAARLLDSALAEAK
ncbi:MAG TPA: glycosyltransferase [Verrucomicrobiae bacterium]|nr:glycosyltransferase [Verrucomicrobiae bacterium]